MKFYLPVHFHEILVPSVLWRCWLGGRKGIRPVKNWVVGCWRGCLGWGADLHTAQQLPLPLTISCSSKSRLVLTILVLPFWYLLTRMVSDIFQKSSKTVVCVCVCFMKYLRIDFRLYLKDLGFDIWFKYFSGKIWDLNVRFYLRFDYHWSMINTVHVVQYIYRPL